MNDGSDASIARDLLDRADASGADVFVNEWCVPRVLHAERLPSALRAALRSYSDDVVDLLMPQPCRRCGRRLVPLVGLDCAACDAFPDDPTDFSTCWRT